MNAVRVAVQRGTSSVRVARVGPGGGVRVVELPVGPGGSVAGLSGLTEGAAEVVVVGSGPVWSRPGARVGSVPAAVAAAAGRPGPVTVVYVGHRGTQVCLVRDGTVVARRRAPGGAQLDGAIAGLLTARCPYWAGHPGLPAQARRVREALSLLPAATVRLPGSAGEVRVDAGEGQDAVRALLDEIVDSVPVRGPAVLLVGGGARMPALAELLDRAGCPDVAVAPRPDAAAVVGALGLPDRCVDWSLSRSPVRPTRCPWLPAAPPRFRRPWRTGIAAVAAAALLLGLHLAGNALAPAPAGVPAGVLVQYGYRVDVPAGWAHTGGLPERRRSLLTPVAAPAGSDLIAVESTPLGYDSDAEPDRAAAELRAEFDAAVAGGADLTGYDVGGSGGRVVTAYQERDRATTVQWYVVLDGDAQLSVGCRYTVAGAAAVRAACERVAGSIAAI